MHFITNKEEFLDFVNEHVNTLGDARTNLEFYESQLKSQICDGLWSAKEIAKFDPVAAEKLLSIIRLNYELRQARLDLREYLASRMEKKDNAQTK